MSRRREIPKREILPDPKYSNIEVAKFVNVLMTRGKKSVAERIIYGALSQVEKKTGKNPVEVFTIALGNIRPIVEVKSRRVGGGGLRPQRGGCRSDLGRFSGRDGSRHRDRLALRGRIQAAPLCADQQAGSG